MYGTIDDPLFVANDVASILGIENSRQMIQTIDDDEKLTYIIDTSGQRRNVNVLTEAGLYEVFFQSRKPAAKEFKKNVKALLKKLRTNGFVDLRPKTASANHIASAKEVRAHYAAIEAKKALLNLNEASVASMVNKTDEALGIKGQYIEYVPSKGVLMSLTALLKEFNVPISAQQANKILQERGIIKQMSRKSSRGEKHFWSIADSNYGENQVNPNNPKETHPMFYQNKFGELIPFLSNNLLAV